MFWGFGVKIKPPFYDVWSIGVLSIGLSDQVLVELDCSFLDGEVATFGNPQWSQSQKALWLIKELPLITFFAYDSLVSVSDRLMATSTRTNLAPIRARVWVDVA